MTGRPVVGRRDFLKATVAAGVVAGVPLSLGATAAQAEDTLPKFRVATLNTFAGLEWDEARADLVRLMDNQNVDLIGLNEIKPNRAQSIREWVRDVRTGWWFYSPTDPDNPWRGMNSVLVRKSVFEPLDSGVRWGSKSYNYNYDIDNRWITWVYLRHRATGAKFNWLQTHTDAAVEDGGHPVNAPERLEGYTTYMNNLKDVVQDRLPTGEVLVAGDWNVNSVADRDVRYWRFPFVALEKEDHDAELPGLRSTYSHFGFGSIAATSGTSRYIDYIAVWMRAFIENRVLTFSDGHTVLTGFNSDHNPLLTTVTVHPDRIG
jgi:hypothetical protein